MLQVYAQHYINIAQCLQDMEVGIYYVGAEDEKKFPDLTDEAKVHVRASRLRALSSWLQELGLGCCLYYQPGTSGCNDDPADRARISSVGESSSRVT